MKESSLSLFQILPAFTLRYSNFIELLDLKKWTTYTFESYRLFASKKMYIYILPFIFLNRHSKFEYKLKIIKKKGLDKIKVNFFVASYRASHKPFNFQVLIQFMTTYLQLKTPVLFPFGFSITLHYLFMHLLSLSLSLATLLYVEFTDTKFSVP